MLEHGKAPGRLGGRESLKTARGALTLRLGAKLADKPHARRERLASDDFARRLAPPIDDSAGRYGKRLVALARQRAKPTRDFRRDDPFDRAAQRAIFERGRAALGLEMEARESANQMTLDRHRALGVDAAKNRAGALTQAAQQRARAPVDKPLHQRFVQRVGKPIFEASRAPLPCLRIGKPVSAIGDIGQGAHPSQP